MAHEKVLPVVLTGPVSIAYPSGTDEIQVLICIQLICITRWLPSLLELLLYCSKRYRLGLSRTSIKGFITKLQRRFPFEIICISHLHNLLVTSYYIRLLLLYDCYFYYKLGIIFRWRRFNRHSELIKMIKTWNQSVNRHENNLHSSFA